MGGLRRWKIAGTKSGSFCTTAARLHVGGCALRLRECIPFACKRGVLSRRRAAGSGSLVARHRQVHAPCEAETGTATKHRSSKQG